MSPHRERVVHGTVVSEHIVQLFDETASLAAGVAGFLADAWARGERLLVVARPGNWAAIAVELERHGYPVVEMTGSGRLLVVDAADTLDRLLANGRPVRAKFAESVGQLVQRFCAESPKGVAIYGEMVDILAAQGSFLAAEQLEALWNELSEACSFRLLCGYAAGHFGHDRDTHHLQAICAAHTHAGARDTDLLATWLLAHRRPHHLDAR